MKPATNDIAERATLRETLSYGWRALMLIWASSRRWSVMNGMFVVIRGLTPLLQLWAVKLIIDVTAKQVTSGEFDMMGVLWALAIMAGTYVLNAVTTSLHSIVKERHSYHLTDHISYIIQRKTLAVSYGFFEDANYHSIFHRAVSESASKPQSLFYTVVGLFQGTLTLMSMAMLLMAIHWSLPIIILLLGLPIVYIRIQFSRRYYALMRMQTDDERRVQYYNAVITGKAHAKEMRIFGLGTLFRRRYRKTLNELRRNRNKLLVSNSIRESMIQLGMSIVFVAVFGLVMWRAVTVGLTVGALAMYLMALQRSYQTAQDLLARIAAVYDSSLFLKNLFAFIDMPLGLTTPTDHFPEKIEKGIRFSNVSFAYPNSDRIVLDKVSFEIKAGETVAIVGRNGSGKSTIIKLLCGLYEPSEGRIEIDGHCVSDMPREEITGNISAIFQDYMLYNASAKDNVRFGGIRREYSDEAIRKASEDAGIDKVFGKLKHGYETPLGNLFPDGEMLSQGEWQRTALARSFYSQSQIIVMDEPTASLDAFTEAQLVDNFHKITIGRTAIIVSHRLSTIRMADRIIVVDNHSIVDIGKYDELMKRPGLFHDMIDSLEK